MNVMKLSQLLQDGVRLLKGWMFHRLVTGNAGKGDARELFGRFYSAHSHVHSASSIDLGMASIIRAVAGQIVGDSHQRAEGFFWI